MATSLQQFYEKRSEECKTEITQLTARIWKISGLRLLVFLLVVGGIYWVWDEWRIALAIGVGGMALFIYLVRITAELSTRKRFFQKKQAINEAEVKALAGDVSEFRDGLAYQSGDHAFSHDIDLFGQGSFFQYLNRSALPDGEQKLASWLLSNDIASIEEKQQVIQELKNEVEWRQNYSAHASLVKNEVSNESILSFLKDYKPFLGSSTVWLTWGFGILSAVVVALAALSVISGMMVFYWTLIGIGIVGRYFKSVSKLQNATTRIKSTFSQYSQLMEMIEGSSFQSKLLQEQSQRINQGEEKPSEILYKFSRALDQLDQRNNLLFAFVGNGFFLWDLIQARRIEKWIAQYGSLVEHWFDTVATFDAWHSLANYAYNHPDFTFPTLSSDELIRLDAEGMGHPLIHSSVRVDNDLKIDHRNFFIITGANMAGKSTFLRTVSLSMVMANSGLPVCAQKYLYRPIKLITSMRTTDSLQKDESYFFSELKRLKYIVDRMNQDEYFIVLDEILKGTNSEDKKNGSKKFVEKLVSTGSTGIIATHDLSLCEIADRIEAVKNYFFEARIENDELHFDYLIKSGICRNMNASFLLKKMEIV
ncbi:DNA mismatch repair protein MutS [bacterium SCSIO 12741]|nr:DNA mismatch repair protein MutS [bacterium SCSIO 12741]